MFRLLSAVSEACTRFYREQPCSLARIGDAEALEAALGEYESLPNASRSRHSLRLFDPTGDSFCFTIQLLMK